MQEIQNSGLYIISDTFFDDYPNNRYMDNKGENRPHYYAIADPSGVLWMIPLSSRVDKYRRLIQQSEERHGAGNCINYFIAPIYGKERAFLICDIFPVLPEHVLRPYTINNSQYIVKNKQIKQAIYKKAKTYLNMVERGVIKSPLDIMSTKKKLLQYYGKSKPEA